MGDGIRNPFEIPSGPAGQPVLAERYLSDMGPPTDAPLAQRELRYRTYRSDNWKLAETSDGRRRLYFLEDDPSEERDPAAERPEQLQRLTEELRQWEQRLGLPALDAAVGEVPAAEVDPAVQERLRQLGYVE